MPSTSGSPTTSPHPLHATKRDPTFATDGGRAAAVSDALGVPFMPWQRLVADVALERHPDGRYHYPVVVVTVPRQSGKTTLLRAVGVERMLFNREHQVFYTAQTGKDARERWRDLVKALQSSAVFQTEIQVKQAAGSERVIMPRTGSEFRCFSPVATSLHGYTPPTVMLDEAFAHDEQRGDDLEGAIMPAQITLPHRQLWIVSTAGTADSTFLRKWVERGRAGQPGVCLVEYAAPDGADPYDPETWATFHPALGHTITTEDLAEVAGAHSRSEFERAYLNRWTTTSTQLIPTEKWAGLHQEQTPPAPGTMALTYDTAYDRSGATIMATWSAGGIIQQRIVQRQPGLDWVVPAVLELKAALDPQLVAADDGGGARQITDELRRSGLEVETMGARDFATAYGRWMSLVDRNALGHDGTDAYAQAVAGLVTRPMGDAVAPSRRHSAGDLSPVIAGIVGAWMVDRREPEGMPLIYVPEAS